MQIVVHLVEIALCGFLLGGLVVMYLRRTTRPRFQSPMFWGGISAIVFVLIAVLSEIGHLSAGNDVTWKSWLGIVGAVCGINAIRLMIRYQGHHGGR